MKTMALEESVRLIATIQEDGDAAILREAADRIREGAELRESVHYANGVAELAMKHRDAAEAELAALKKRIGRSQKVWVNLRNMAEGACPDDCFGCEGMDGCSSARLLVEEDND